MRDAVAYVRLAARDDFPEASREIVEPYLVDQSSSRSFMEALATVAYTMACHIRGHNTDLAERVLEMYAISLADLDPGEVIGPDGSS